MFSGGEIIPAQQDGSLNVIFFMENKSSYTKLGLSTTLKTPRKGAFSDPKGTPADIVLEPFIGVVAVHCSYKVC